MSKLRDAINRLEYGQYHGVKADDECIPELLEMLRAGDVVFHHLVMVQLPPPKKDER